MMKKSLITLSLMLLALAQPLHAEPQDSKPQKEKTAKKAERKTEKKAEKKAKKADKPKKSEKTATKPQADTAPSPVINPAKDSTPSPNTTADIPQIAATAYLVQDLQSGQILAEHGLHQPIEPASLTKMMTAYLTFKALETGKIKPDQMFNVSQKAWKAEGSRMFLEAGKKVSVSDLLKGLIVLSANDSAIALAEGLANGDETQFVATMNAEAKRLGMNDTHYENSTGLTSKNHLTTVEDLAILAAAIIHDYPQYYPIFSIKSFTYNKITQPNRNLLLYRDDNVDGLKTGHTNSAGYNLVASSKRNGRRVLSIVVGTESAEARATESSKLLNFALNQFDTPELYKANESIAQIKVYKGEHSQLNVGFDKNEFITIPQGRRNQLKPILETKQPIVAPIQKGQEMGVLKLMDGNKVLVERPVYALEDIAEASLLGRVKDGIALWFQTMFEEA